MPVPTTKVPTVEKIVVEKIVEGSADPLGDPAVLESVRQIVADLKLADCGQRPDLKLLLEAVCKEYDKRAPPWPEGVRQGR